MATRTIRVAVIPGDGVGPEVIEEGVRVLSRTTSLTGSSIAWDHFPWGSDFYRKTGRMMPEDSLTTLSAYDAIYLGAVGDPDLPDDLTLWGLTLPIRQAFDQYVNLRPIRWLSGVPPRLADKTPEQIDMLFVRENTEGEYVDVGGVAPSGGRRLAVQAGIFTEGGIERIARFAFEAARARRRHVTSVTKSNALRHSMVLWDDVVARVASEFPDVEVRRVLVDAAAYEMVLRPERFDVVVAGNLFGDILTDLGGALQGSLGLSASANLDPSGNHPSAFEPVHGSAPDIAGAGIANPGGAIWAGALMLQHLGLHRAAELVMDALSGALADGHRTPDLGGSRTTREFAEAVLERVERRRRT